MKLKKALDTLSRVDPQVSCRVSSSILTFVDKEKRNLEQFLENVSVSKEHLLDANSWISTDVIETLFNRLEISFYDPDIAYKLGRQAAQLGAWGVLESVFRMIGDPCLIFHQARKFVGYFYKDIELTVKEKSEFHVILEFSGANAKHPHLSYLRGIFESIPMYWQLGHAFSEKINDCTYEFRWENKQEFFGQKDTQVSLSPQLIQDTIVQLEKTISLIEKKNRELEEKNDALTKAHLKLTETFNEKIQSEKLASIGQLAVGVAHEINNPLGFIMSNVQRATEYTKVLTDFIRIFDAPWGGDQLSDADFVAIQKRMKDFLIDHDVTYVLKDFPALLQESKEGLDRVKQIVEDLNTFARMAPEDMQLADIHQGLDSTLNLLRYELKKKARVVKNYGLLPRVRCNLPKLNQVFLNLFINACQAIDREGEIKVETESKLPWVMVKISDTGCGIDQKDLNKVFDPFYTTKKEGHNMGLGLSTALSIVQQHQGDIQLESRPSEGTRVTVMLPMSGVRP
ncbi:MAG: GHKL domain-containing protein [Deltaproteobacteria bacterium]|nr:GHKL domain-containing protein [Deltaproteobacteria bacterium]